MTHPQATSHPPTTAPETLNETQPLTITYPTKDAQDLQQILQHLKTTQHLNLSAFCRAAIAEKLQRLQQETIR